MDTRDIAAPLRSCWILPIKGSIFDLSSSLFFVLGSWQLALPAFLRRSLLVVSDFRLRVHEPAMASVTMSNICDHQSILDRSQIRTLTSKLAVQQDKLVKELTSKTTPSRSSSVHDFSEWLRVKEGLEQYTYNLQSLLEDVEKAQPANSTSTWQTSLVALQQTEEKQRVLNALRNILELLQNIEQHIDSAPRSTSARQVTDAKDLLKDLGKEERYGLKLVSILKARRTELQTSLERRINEDFRSLIKVEPVTSGEEGSLRIHEDFANRFTDIFESAQVLNINDKLLEDFSRTVLAEIIEPMASGKIDCVPLPENNNSENILKFRSVSNSEVKILTYRLDNLIMFFEFLEQNLSSSPENFRVVFVTSMSSSMNLAELVKSKSITEMLPQNTEEFSRVKPLFLDKLRALRSLLVRIGWVIVDDKDWSALTESLDDLHVAKSAQDILIFARNVFVSEKEFLKTHVVGSKLEERMEVDEESGDDFAFFRLQEMTVSSAVLEVGQRSFKLLSDATTSSSSMHLLVSDVHNSLAMLLDVVPYCLKDRMTNIPSIGALYFTSCMYASRQCVLLNRIVQKSTDKPSSNFSLSFADLSLKLLIIAYETLNSLCERFSAEVLEVLSTEQAAWLTKFAQNELFTRIKVLLDRSTLKRGMDIVRRLASVWNDIMPALVFQQAAGTIVNAVMSDMVERVIDTEEIGEADSKTLCDNMDWLIAEVTEILKVGQSGVEVAPFKFVTTWFRFLEVKFMLDARMGEVADRWLDGDGPLAQHLKPEEVKKMVRALFDNNEKRAKLLAMIR